jgi:hypothetical protein
LLVLPRPQRAPRCAGDARRCRPLLSVAEGFEDVLHEKDEMEVVGR